MNATATLITRFPHACIHADERLLTWHPVGVFDEKTADQILEYLELAERFEGEPFHRYTDLTRISEIQIGLATSSASRDSGSATRAHG